MYRLGEYVVYGTSGVCRVEEITTMEMGGKEEDRLFYALTPLSQKGGRIFTPVDKQKTMMRKVMSREEASQLIENIPEIEPLGIINDKQREDHYRNCMKSCDCIEWVKVIKTLYQRKVERSAQGKKITAVDEKYLKLAEDYLYHELSIPLGIPKEGMGDYIARQLDEM